ncbi:hypothetical protein [Edaphobacter sp. DSM 109919]|uniref:Uncharacterized protein n=1 Tax=Edaphobacter paludis TaxID=3035702 RepID=A0AAU7CYH2_9BACT
MATINITDSSAAQASIDLATSASDFGSNPASALRFIDNDIVKMLDLTIDQAPLSNLSLGFSYTPSFAVGADSKFTVGGALTSTFSIFRRPPHPEAGAPLPNLFPSDPLGDDPLSLSDTCYTMLQCAVGLNLEATDKSSPYAFVGGSKLQASASIYLPYPKSSGYPTLKTALAEAFSNYSIPTTRLALAALPEGHIFTYDVSGTLTATGKFNLVAAVNPTVSAGVTETIELLSVDVGPEVTVGGCITLASDFQIRVRKIGANSLRIGHYRKRGSTLTVTFDAGASVDATAGGVDLIAPIFKLLGSGSDVSKQWLEQQGAKDLADDIQDSLTKAVQQKLSIALDAETDVTASDSSAFLFDFDLAELDTQGQRALDALLIGDLGQLIMAGPLPKGITKHASVLDRIRSTTHTLSVNFLGVLSYADITKYALQSTAKYTENGEIALMDKATASQTAVTATPLVASQRLHHLLADLFTATVSYHCSAGNAAPDFTAIQQFYDYERKVDPSTLGWFRDLAIQLGKEYQLPGGPFGGPAWMNILLTYKKRDAMLLFLDSSGHARPQSDFVIIGRRAMAAAVEANPVVGYLAHMQESEPYWDAIVDKDPGNLAWPMNGLQKTEFGMACFAVGSWASSMSKVSKLIEQMITYTGSHDASSLPADKNFLDLRSQLASQLKQASSKLVGTWVPGWSIFAVYFCHAPSSGNVALGFLKQSFIDSLP